MEENTLRAFMKQWQYFFPLTNIETISELVENVLLWQGSTSLHGDPTLLLVSTILGYFEHELTAAPYPQDAIPPVGISESTAPITTAFPCLTFEECENLIYRIFHMLQEPKPPIAHHHQSTHRGRKRPQGSKESVCQEPDLHPPKAAQSLASDDDSEDEPLVKLRMKTASHHGASECGYSHSAASFPDSACSLGSSSAREPLTKGLSALVQDWASGDTHDVGDLAWCVACLVCSLADCRPSSDLLHHQSLFAFQKDHKLDTFGLAYLVVASCYLVDLSEDVLALEPQDRVALALSEDYAWVKTPSGHLDVAMLLARVAQEKMALSQDGFHAMDYSGPLLIDDMKSRRSCELTEESMSSWLYLEGHPVLCATRRQCVAAAVTAMNTTCVFHVTLESSTSSTTTRRSHKKQSNSNGTSVVLREQESSFAVRLKHCLLHMLHRTATALHTYPLALSSLADLCEVEIALSSSQCTQPDLLRQHALTVCQQFYGDRLVYPYLGLANYCFRQGRWLEAMRFWADAANVVGRYNYTPTDTELYEDFFRVATATVPNLLRQGLMHSHEELSEAFHHFLRLFDGLCRWEEGSPRPVLHIVWARKFIACLHCFPAHIRTLFTWETEEQLRDTASGVPPHVEATVEELDVEISHTCQVDQLLTEVACFEEREDHASVGGVGSVAAVCSSISPDTTSHFLLDDEGHETKSVPPASQPGPGDPPSPEWLPQTPVLHLCPGVAPGYTPEEVDLSRLASQCDSLFLNPLFLLGHSCHPFLEEGVVPVPLPDITLMVQALLQHDSSPQQTHSDSAPAALTDTCSDVHTSNEPLLTDNSPHEVATAVVSPPAPLPETCVSIQPPQPRQGPALHSQKMRSLRAILTARKLDTQTVELLLTAQSEVHVKRTDLLPAASRRRGSRRV